MKPILFNTQMVQAILDCRKTVTRRLVKEKIVKGLDFRCDGTPWYYTSEKGLCWEVEDVAPYQNGDILYVRETFAVGRIDSGEESDGSEKLYISQCMKENDIIPKEYALRNGIGIDDVIWKPSIFMPKEAARIFLKVTDVRVERLQNISEEQALKEGIVRVFDHMSEETYKKWAHGITELKQCEHPFENYLWHGNFNCGSGSKMSDAWKYQYSGYPNPRDSFSSLWNTTVKLNEWDKFGWKANPWVWVIEFERISKEETNE